MYRSARTCSLAYNELAIKRVHSELTAMVCGKVNAIGQEYQFQLRIGPLQSMSSLDLAGALSFHAR